MSASYEKPASDFDVIRTERINVYGLKATYGLTREFSRSMTRARVLYSIYGGIGLRYKSFWYESRDGSIGGTPIDYVLEQGQQLLPTLHVGVLLTMGFAN